MLKYHKIQRSRQTGNPVLTKKVRVYEVSILCKGSTIFYKYWIIISIFSQFFEKFD